MKKTYGMRFNETMETQGTRRTRRGQDGASLIEVMVVLVIVLIGLFLAIRVFPVGFGVLRSNGNRTVATQLAENMMGMVKGDAAYMPEGVLFAYQDVNPTLAGQTILKTFTDISPDNLDFCYQSATNPCSEDRTLPRNGNDMADINKFRFIKGEAVKIPLPTPTAYGSGSLYTIKFGPFFSSNLVGNPLSFPNAATLPTFNTFLRVYGAPLSGRPVVVPAGASADYLFGLLGLIPDEQSYLIDYGTQSGTPQIFFPPRQVAGRANPNRIFNITVTYDNGSQIVTADADPIVVPDVAATGTPAAYPIRIGGATPGPIVPGTEVVTRNFLRIASNATFDPTDPYQYKLLSPNLLPANTGSTQRNANIGVLAFNPSGASYDSSTGNSAQPFTAYVDYQTLDWHIIRDDREVPSVLPVTAQVEGGGAPVTLIPVRTTLRSIKRVGDPESDNTFYPGIYGSVPGPNTDSNPKDFQVYALDALPNPANPATNLPLGSPLVASSAYSQGGNLTVATRNAAYYMLRDVRNRPGASVRKDSSYETGVIYANTAYLQPGTKIRMLYKGVGDWGIALSKAYARYNQVQGPLIRPGAFGTFVLNKAFSGSRLTAAQLRFPYADFNKSVTVTLQYTKEGGEVVRLSPIQVNLDRRGQDLTADPALFDQRFAFANVADYIPFLNRNDFNNNAIDCQVIGPAVGVSVKTRVVWHDNDTPNERWHVQDMDSYLKTTTVR
ncbi:MAG: hypothetical protein SFU56_15250 [Capsulimonadales bacterium]|nr:hypothetical protein [Capsulimonadales bacterium]